VPMLDHEFIEWVTALPPDWKLRGRTQKYILRKLAERVGVPREVLAILLEPRTLQRGYFEADGVRWLMDDHLHRGRNMTGRIWRLLIFELWHRNFLERFSKPAGLFARPLVADSRTGVPVSPPLNSAMAPAPAGAAPAGATLAGE